MLITLWTQYCCDYKERYMLKEKFCKQQLSLKPESLFCDRVGDTWPGSKMAARNPRQSLSDTNNE